MAKIMINGVESTALDFCAEMIKRYRYDAKVEIEELLIAVDPVAWRNALDTFSLTIVDTVEYFLSVSEEDVII